MVFGHMVEIDRENDTNINMNVNAQRRSMKAILLLFVEPYIAGTRDSEKFIFPDLKNVNVVINGSPNSCTTTALKKETFGEKWNAFS